jgi:hypothetical protein
MLDQPSKHTEKSKPGWRFVKLFGYGETPSAGPSNQCATRHKLGIQRYKGRASRQIATLSERAA